MKNITFTIPYNEEKISALKMFLDKKSLKLEDELFFTYPVYFTTQAPIMNMCRVCFVCKGYLPVNRGHQNQHHHLRDNIL